MNLWRWLEQLLEGLWARLSGAAVSRTLQPVEIGGYLARLMVEDRRVSVDKVYVPNSFTVCLHPGDWEKIKPLVGTVTADLVHYLHTRARRADLSFAGPVHIEFHPADDVPKGSVHAKASFVEGPQGVVSGPGEQKRDENALKEGLNDPSSRQDRTRNPVAENIWARSVVRDGSNDGGSTQVFKIESRLADSISEGRLIVVDGVNEGRSWIVGTDPLYIGRGKDQDVHLDDPNVSRGHAVIYYREHRYWIEDRNSTNGLWLNGRRVDKAVLHDGDIVRVGLTRLWFHAVR